MALKELLGENYKEDLTAKEIEELLADKKLADLSSGNYVYKSKLLDVEKKKKELENQLREKMTAEEKQKLEFEEKEKYYKNLERELELTKVESTLDVKDEALRKKMAEMLVDGDKVGFLKAQKEYNQKIKEEIEKQIKEELLRTNPQTPPQNNGDTGKKWSEMTLDERVQLKREDPQKYELLKKQNKGD